MAEKYFHIPGQSTSTWSPAGQVQIEIFYPDSATSHTDLNVDIVRIAPIQYHLEVDPQKGKFRFGYVKIRFYNRDNLFETSGVLNANKTNQTFCHIKINGSKFFTGLLKWDQIKKSDWYWNNGNLQYRLIELTFTDVVEYTLQKTLSDASYTEGIYFEDLFRNIATMLYLDDIRIHEDFLIQESRGAQYSLNANSYDDGLRLADMDPNMNLLDFLKLIARGMGMFIYQQNGFLWLRQRDLTTSVITLDQNKIARMDKIGDRVAVDFVEVKATKDWKSAYGGSVAIDNAEYSKSYGTSSANSNRNVSIDATGILDHLCVPTPTAGADQIPAGTNYPTAVDTTNYEWLEDVNYSDFLNPTDYVESGMLLRINSGGYFFYSIHNATDAYLYFKNPAARSFTTSDDYAVFRRKGTSSFPNYDWLFKVYLATNKAASIYNKVYLQRGDRIKLQYVGLLNIADALELYGKRYVIERATLDIKKNLSIVEAIEL